MQYVCVNSQFLLENAVGITATNVHIHVVMYSHNYT